MYKTTAIIEGMMCGMCESHVADAIRKSCDVKSVKASKAKKNAVILSENAITEEDLHKAIDPTGYELISVKSEPYEKKGFPLLRKVSSLLGLSADTSVDTPKGTSKNSMKSNHYRSILTMSIRLTFL